jgi:uncharacterized protein
MKPTGQPIIDTMIGFRYSDARAHYDFITRQTKDEESKSEFTFPAQYMFKDVPKVEAKSDRVHALLELMDKFGIERAMIGVASRGDSSRSDDSRRALREHPDRFFGCIDVDPNRGMDAVRDMVHAVEELGVKAASAFPCGLNPQVPINDKKFFPIYAKCVELDIPINVTAGVPGPRLPFAPQYVGLIDEVCWFFPELKFVTRHGCEPWADLAVKLLLKWPNLYYSTSAFAPKYYPKDVVNFANTRGADKVMYAGYFPMGLTLERIFGDMPDVPFRDHVWPKFLRENAIRVFKLDAS